VLLAGTENIKRKGRKGRLAKYAKKNPFALSASSSSWRPLRFMLFFPYAQCMEFHAAE
jgi:hypothetical protein